jgi:hypothetical protein
VKKLALILLTVAMTMPFAQPTPACCLAPVGDECCSDPAPACPATPSGQCAREAAPRSVAPPTLHAFPHVPASCEAALPTTCTLDGASGAALAHFQFARELGRPRGAPGENESLPLRI